MAQPSNIYGVARIHALELRLLDSGKIERMVEASTPDDVLKILAESGEYGSSMADIQGPWDYEKLLISERKRLVDLLSRISPSPEITDIFFMKYDIHNLKVLLKAHYLDRNYDELLSETGIYEIPVMKEALAEGDHRHLPAFMGRAIEDVHTASEDKVDPQRIEVILDRAYYLEVLSRCRKHKQRFCIDYFSREIDLSNIKSFFRVVIADLDHSAFTAVFIPGGTIEERLFWKAYDEGWDKLPEMLRSSDFGALAEDGVADIREKGKLGDFEKEVDNHLFSFVRNSARNRYDSIEPILAYIFAKEYEAKAIRAIMVGKLNGLDNQAIRERLRDSYV